MRIEILIPLSAVDSIHSISWSKKVVLLHRILLNMEILSDSNSQQQNTHTPRMGPTYKLTRNLKFRPIYWERTTVLWVLCLLEVLKK